MPRTGPTTWRARARTSENRPIDSLLEPCVKFFTEAIVGGEGLTRDYDRRCGGTGRPRRGRRFPLDGDLSRPGTGLRLARDAAGTCRFPRPGAARCVLLTRGFVILGTSACSHKGWCVEKLVIYVLKSDKFSIAATTWIASEGSSSNRISRAIAKAEKDTP